ncbi:MAG: carbohydrate ABC transporter permease [Bacteroidota bacterium]
MSVTKKTSGDRIFSIFNISLLTAISIIILYPLIYMVSASFSDPEAVIQGKVVLLPVKFNIDAYLRVLKNPDILIGYRNTVLYTTVGVIVNIIMTTFAAYPLSRKNFYGRNVITMFITFTMFFNAGLIPNYLVITQLGLRDNFWVMIFPGAITVMNLIIMRTFFQNSIPEELYEAAFTDGCTNIQALFKIVLPLSKPVLAVMVLFYGVMHWNSFFNALIYLTDRQKYPLQIILREILIQSKMQDMMESSSEAVYRQQLLYETLKFAVIVVSSLPMLAIYPIIQRYFVKGVMIGAIKG